MDLSRLLSRPAHIIKDALGFRPNGVVSAGHPASSSSPPSSSSLTATAMLTNGSSAHTIASVTAAEVAPTVLATGEAGSKTTDLNNNNSSSNGSNSTPFPFLATATTATTAAIDKINTQTPAMSTVETAESSTGLLPSYGDSKQTETDSLLGGANQQDDFCQDANNQPDSSLISAIPTEANGPVLEMASQAVELVIQPAESSNAPPSDVIIDEAVSHTPTSTFTSTSTPTEQPIPQPEQEAAPQPEESASTATEMTSAVDETPVESISTPAPQSKKKAARPRAPRQTPATNQGRRKTAASILTDIPSSMDVANCMWDKLETAVTGLTSEQISSLSHQRINAILCDDGSVENAELEGAAEEQKADGQILSAQSSPQNRPARSCKRTSKLILDPFETVPEATIKELSIKQRKPVKQNQAITNGTVEHETDAITATSMKTAEVSLVSASVSASVSAPTPAPKRVRAAKSKGASGKAANALNGMALFERDDEASDDDIEDLMMTRVNIPEMTASELELVEDGKMFMKSGLLSKDCRGIIWDQTLINSQSQPQTQPEPQPQLILQSIPQQQQKSEDVEPMDLCELAGDSNTNAYSMTPAVQLNGQQSQLSQLSQQPSQSVYTAIERFCARRGISNESGVTLGLLPLPLEFGAEMLRREANFVLPMLVAEDVLMGKVAKVTSRKSSQYVKLTANIYQREQMQKNSSSRQNKATNSIVPIPCLCVEPPHVDDYSAIDSKLMARLVSKFGEAVNMECVPSSILHRRGCGEDCLNRASFYECDPTSCPAGNECSNQPIRRGEHQISSLQVFHTGHCGYGVRAKTPILPGTFIIEYIGEVISQLEVQRRMENEYKGWQDYYFLDYEHGYVIDAGLKGNISRFINHSCDPNCIVERWIVDGRSRVGIFARRFIPPGEELSYDYNFDVFSIKDVPDQTPALPTATPAPTPAIANTPAAQTLQPPAPTAVNGTTQVTANASEPAPSAAPEPPTLTSIDAPISAPSAIDPTLPTPPQVPDTVTQPSIVAAPTDLPAPSLPPAATLPKKHGVAQLCYCGAATCRKTISRRPREDKFHHTTSSMVLGSNKLIASADDEDDFYGNGGYSSTTFRSSTRSSRAAGRSTLNGNSSSFIREDSEPAQQAPRPKRKRRVAETAEEEDAEDGNFNPNTGKSTATKSKRRRTRVNGTTTATTADTTAAITADTTATTAVAAATIATVTLEAVGSGDSQPMDIDATYPSEVTSTIEVVQPSSLAQIDAVPTVAADSAFLPPAPVPEPVPVELQPATATSIEPMDIDPAEPQTLATAVIPHPEPESTLQAPIETAILDTATVSEPLHA